MSLLEEFLASAGYPGAGPLRFCPGCRVLCTDLEPRCAICAREPVEAASARDLAGRLVVSAGAGPARPTALRAAVGALRQLVIGLVPWVLIYKETPRNLRWTGLRAPGHDEAPEVAAVPEAVGLDGPRRVELGRVLGPPETVVLVEHRLRVADARDALVLRSAACYGFSVELDDHRVVDIAPGSARCIDIARRATPRATGRLPGGHDDLIHDVLEIRGGDRLGLQGQLTALPARAREQLYREASTPRFTLAGLPVLRLFS